MVESHACLESKSWQQLLRSCTPEEETRSGGRRRNATLDWALEATIANLTRRCSTPSGDWHRFQIQRFEFELPQAA